MAKNKAYTGKYDNDGNDDEMDAEVAAASAPPPPGIAPHGVPAGLPPESYMTSQEAHVAGGGEYAPPPETEEELATRRAKEAKEADARRAKEAKESEALEVEAKSKGFEELEAEAKSRKAKKEDKY